MSESEFRCPECGEEMEGLASEGIDKRTSAAMCLEHECLGGVLIHIPKGDGPGDLMAGISEVRELLEKLTVATIRNALGR